jgi:hypothetical protein
VAQLHTQHGRLQRVQPAVGPEHHVVVLVGAAAVVRHPAQAVDEGRVVRGDHPRVSVRPQVLAGVEAEAGRVAQAARSPAADLRAVRLRCVLQHGQAVALPDGQDGVHVRGMAVEVNRQQHLRARRDRGLQLARVHRERLGVHVHEHGARAVQEDGLAGGDERVGDRDHLVARPHPVGPERQDQRVRAVGDAARVRGPAVRRELLLQAEAVLAPDELGRGQHALEGGRQLLADARVLRPEIHHGHGLVGHGEKYLR